MKPENFDVGVSPHRDRTNRSKSISWEVVAIGAIVVATAVNALWIVTGM
ncbi:hypothetical protein [Croceicoccus sediminis]|nr:hypothetical protein [Croceicoccus sediminis]